MAQDRRIEVEGRTVWTKKSTTAIVHPITQGMYAAAIAEARPTLITLDGLMSDIEVALGYPLADTDDEDEWGTTATVLSASYRSAAGDNFESAWTDLTTALTKRLVRWVLLVRNKTGSTLEIAQVSVRLDLREG